MTFLRRALDRCLIPAIAVVLAGCGSAAGAPSGMPDPTAGAATALPTATASPAATSSPAPSTETTIPVADGEPWILYSWFRPGTDEREIYLVRPDGTDAHAVVTDVPGNDTSPAWSPDGSRFAFGNSQAIWVADADGTGAEMVTDGAGQCPDGVYYPDWSPDGTQLAVVCYQDTNPGGGSIATFDLATKTLTPLIRVAWPEHLDGHLSWSPDGSEIAFAILHWDPTDQFLDGSQIAIVPAAGGPERRITELDAFMSHPDWSPDGSELVMHPYDLGNMHTSDQPSNLFTIKPDGTGQRQVTTSSIDANRRFASPRWLPDGSGLVLSVGISRAGNGTVDDVQVAVVDSLGAEPVLLEPAVHGGSPDFRPTP